MAIGSGVLLPGVAENPTFPILRPLAYTTGLGYRPTCDNGSTVNMSTVDLSKAFDRMNHFVLFIKLMDRRLPLQLLNLFVLWFSMSKTCVRWGSYDSHFFKLAAGVRQGGVLSLYFFAIFVDGIVNKIVESNAGCYIRNVCMSIFCMQMILSCSVRLLAGCRDYLESVKWQSQVGR